MKDEEFHNVNLKANATFSVPDHISGHKSGWSLYSLSAKSKVAHRNYLVTFSYPNSILKSITKQSALRS